MTPETRGNAKYGVRLIGRAVVPRDERTILEFRPSLWMIVLRSLPPVLVIAGVVFGLAWCAILLRGVIATNPPVFDWGRVQVGLAVSAGLIVLWNGLDYLTRRYVLTESRAILVWGVLHQRIADLPVGRIQNIAVSKPLILRILGLGHVGLASAGTDGYEVVWGYVRAPEKVVERVRAPAGDAARLPILIGLAGGVGSGKSTVGRLFAELGCVVVDSDALSKEAIQTAEVKARLREWWGEDIFTDEGAVDRGAVAKIVFEDEGERARLESLIHPLIEAERARLITEAGAAGAVAVVVDAPLLFEAGLDKGMDAVVFVDTPFEKRLERVREARGWDEQELRRREKAQMGLEEKRDRSDHTVVNAGGLDDLRRRVSGVFTRITEAMKAV